MFSLNFKQIDPARGYAGTAQSKNIFTHCTFNPNSLYKYTQIILDRLHFQFSSIMG